jgi:hypothetical protein
MATAVSPAGEVMLSDLNGATLSATVVLIAPEVSPSVLVLTAA